jgi:O-antigen ligase
MSLVSVLVNAGALNQTLELGDAVKSLLLLGTYAVFFFVIATSVRPSEIRAFFKYTLLLAVLCAIGTLVEFRFHYNVFYDVSGKLLGHVFDVQAAQDVGVDELGRPVVLGPGAVGLEVATMLAMAVPLALIGFINATRRRDRILYGLAACIVLAAGLATYKKTAIVAPGVVVLCIALLQPRQVRRLLPLAIVMLIASHALAPGSLGSVVGEFTGGRLTAVGTTQHREDGYDAIRPLVWSQPLLGMGYGSYNGGLNRILDNQMLDNLIDTGVVGELCYVLLAVSVFSAAWRIMRLVPRDERAILALGGALSAVVFLTTSLLFDVMSFPHVPYIFLTMAGFVAVLARDTPGAWLTWVREPAALADP